METKNQKKENIKFEGKYYKTPKQCYVSVEETRSEQWKHYALWCGYNPHSGISFEEFLTFVPSL